MTLDAVVMEFYEHARLSEEKKAPAHSEEELAKHRTRLGAVLDVIDGGLSGRDVLVGGAFSAADGALKQQPGARARSVCPSTRGDGRVGTALGSYAPHALKQAARERR